MKVLEEIYQGKAKKVYRTDESDVYMVEYRDDATAFNGLKKDVIQGKGELNNMMSNMFFKILEKEGVKTHYIEEVDSRKTFVRAVEIIPLEVIIRNVAAGSFSKRYGVEEGSELKRSTLEFSLKDDDLGDPLINRDHALALGIASEDEISKIIEYAHRVNEILSKFFLEKGIKLIDFKLEFGRYKGDVILADEISPDTCRLWDIKTSKKLDKDRFRHDMGDVIEAYQEVFKRVK